MFPKSFENLEPLILNLRVVLMIFDSLKSQTAVLK